MERGNKLMKGKRGEKQFYIPTGEVCNREKADRTLKCEDAERSH